MTDTQKNNLGLTQEGLQTALNIKHCYQNREPVCMPDDNERILLPELLLNRNVDLTSMEDPLPLAMLATRDPEAPMSIAAITRLGPLGRQSKLISGVVQVVGETSKHTLVRECVNLITESAFDPDAIAKIHHHANQFIVRSRQQYTMALRQNLKGLMDGTVTPRDFVHDFFELTEAGNLRNDIRKRLVLSLLLSENVRPSVKFLVLENFYRLSKPVRASFLSAVPNAEPSHHIDLIKEEIRWIVAQERLVPGLG